MEDIKSIGATLERIDMPAGGKPPQQPFDHAFSLDSGIGKTIIRCLLNPHSREKTLSMRPAN